MTFVSRSVNLLGDDLNLTYGIDLHDHQELLFPLDEPENTEEND